MHRRPKRVVFAPAAIIALLAGCDLFGPGASDSLPPDPITELPRALTVAEARVIENGNAFGFDLLREVASRDARPNIVVSPLSATMALGMTLNGADGETFDAMRRTLGFEDLSQEAINASYAGLIELLTTLDPAVRFDIANSVWAREGVPFHQSFLDAVAEAFAARVESRDFDDPATLDAINAWVEEHTDGHIDEIVDALDPFLVMLLVNAIFFEGSWTHGFDPADTRRADFRVDADMVVQVDMMELADVELPFGGGPDYVAVELPYGGQAFSMVVVVPHGDVRDFVGSLDSERWDGIVGGLSARTIDLLALPRLTLSFDAYLNDALIGMGMEPAFYPGADFTRMSPSGDQLCIGFVRQKTFLEVDEEGTRAAAATAVGMRLVSFTGVVADRPFVVAIRERLSGTVVFVGLVGDPTANDPGPEPYTPTCVA